MHLKGKKIKPETPLLLARTSKKLQNRPTEPTDPNASRVARVNQMLAYPLLLSIEQGFLQSHLMHSLKESLTVKKIQFSRPKACPSVNLSTAPFRYKSTKPNLLEKVESFRSMQRQRPKAKSVSEKLYLKKIKKVDKTEKLEKIDSPQSTPKRPTAAKKEHLTPRIPIFAPPLVKVARPLPKMMLKEALRNNNWASRARPELEKMWRRFINKSNGIEPLNQSKSNYRYFVGKGNNSRLICRILSSRSWWSECEDISEANFAWTQWKDKPYLQTIKTHPKSSVSKSDTIPIVMISPISISVEKNQYRPVDIEDLGFQHIRNSSSYISIDVLEVEASLCVLYNKLEFNQHLANKKGLFKSLKNYYNALGRNAFDCIPLTFHVKKGEDDPEFAKVLKEFAEIESERTKTRLQNLWIVKPGENSNRGQGISLANSIEQLKALVDEAVDPLTLKPRTYIIQKYIERPFLIHKRKFDIRCFAMLSSINGVLQGYFYSDGYLRTSSAEYNTKDIANTFIHLTNDAIQKHCEEYGKFEDGNKLSYKDFQRYLDFHCTEKKITFTADVVPVIKGLVKDTFQAVYLKIDPKRRLNCVEIFGYDFMLDGNLKPWLIEVNTNPCLELASGYLSILIPGMIENAMRVVLDPLFPPPAGKSAFESFMENKFELIFHQETDGVKLLSEIGENQSLLLDDNEDISDKDEMFSDVE